MKHHIDVEANTLDKTFKFEHCPQCGAKLVKIGRLLEGNQMGGGRATNCPTEGCLGNVRLPAEWKII